MTIHRTPNDSFPTLTSVTQEETEQILLEHLPKTDKDSESKAKLEKNVHMQFLARSLMQGFPARYVSQDASQPWLLYWILEAFSILQVGLDPGNKQRAIDTIMTWQHPDGGFGGGPGHSAHLLPTYAAVCALAIVGRPGAGGGWDQIDREKIYKWFMSLKQPDGSFLVSHHAEVDVRGIYCLVTTAILLDILTPELVEGTAEFIASCQTYEGGFSCSSQPYFAAGPNPVLLASHRPPLGEAHGGYTFCSLATWVMLQPLVSSSPKPPTINIKNATRWLAHMQGVECELGGFKGRTNKLVDGCYSWWVGGAFGLLEALYVERTPGSPSSDVKEEVHDGDEWDDVDDSLLNRKALQEYILYAGQHPAGGLRDKPPKGADAYHTLYCLAGFSSAQHRLYPSSSRKSEILAHWTSSTGPNEELRKSVFGESLSWIEDEGASKFVGGASNRVNATHPVFNLTMTHTEAIMGHFYKQTVPPRSRK